MPCLYQYQRQRLQHRAKLHHHGIHTICLHAKQFVDKEAIARAKPPYYHIHGYERNAEFEHIARHTACVGVTSDIAGEHSHLPLHYEYCHYTAHYIAHKHGKHTHIGIHHKRNAYEEYKKRADYARCGIEFVVSEGTKHLLHHIVDRECESEGYGKPHIPYIGKDAEQNAKHYAHHSRPRKRDNGEGHYLAPFFLAITIDKKPKCAVAHLQRHKRHHHKHHHKADVVIAKLARLDKKTIYRHQHNGNKPRTHTAHSIDSHISQHLHRPILFFRVLHIYYYQTHRKLKNCHFHHNNL